VCSSDLQQPDSVQAIVLDAVQLWLAARKA